MLPLEVLERAGSEITNYQGSGMSVMEMSHRSKVFLKIFEDTKAKFRQLMNVPEDYEILFLQGGASLQFAMAPMNLIGRTGRAESCSRISTRRPMPGARSGCSAGRRPRCGCAAPPGWRGRCWTGLVWT